MCTSRAHTPSDATQSVVPIAALCPRVFVVRHRHRLCPTLATIGIRLRLLRIRASACVSVYMPIASFHGQCKQWGLIELAMTPRFLFSVRAFVLANMTGFIFGDVRRYFPCCCDSFRPTVACGHHLFVFRDLYSTVRRSCVTWNVVFQFPIVNMSGGEIFLATPRRGESQFEPS